MVIVRFEPGTEAPEDGVFALVGHYGEASGFVCECLAGEALPESAVEGPEGRRLWYVRLEPVSEVRLAA